MAGVHDAVANKFVSPDKRGVGEERCAARAKFKFRFMMFTFKN